VKTAARQGRRRRTAEEARHEILAAAQRRLAEGGPEAIRLQDIARDVGISHPAILHHFESREGLMRALARSAMSAMNADVLRAIADPRRDTAPGAVLDRVFETLGESGHARLLAWAALSPHGPTPGDDDQQLLRGLADALYQRLRERARRADATPPPREDTVFAVRLTAAAMIGDALLGGVFSRSAGLADDHAVQRRFRNWLARLLDERFRLPTATRRRARRSTERGRKR
jgi:AcrR family transcriptional regulator